MVGESVGVPVGNAVGAIHCIGNIEQRHVSKQTEQALHFNMY